MKKKLYKFPFDQRNVSRGPVNVEIANGQAIIDPDNAAQVALAEELGGTEAKAPTPKSKIQNQKSKTEVTNG